MVTLLVVVALWLCGWALCVIVRDAYDTAARNRRQALLDSYAHPRAIRDQAMPQPDPYVYDPASLHDAVLLSLSPSIRRDFQSPKTNITIVDGPTGPSSKEGLPGPSNISIRSRTELRGSVPKSSTSKDGLQGPSTRP